jgi:putative copper export protein
MYDLLLFLHVLSVIAGLGPTYALPGLMKLRGDPPSAAVLRAEAVISRYATIAVAVILVTGIGLISTSPYVKGQFGDAHWLHLGIALFVVLAGLGTGYAAPRMRKAVSAAEAGDGAGVRSLLDPLDKVVGPILGLLGAVIVYLMLVKPDF